jgi:hypothetical protein
MDKETVESSLSEAWKQLETGRRENEKLRSEIDILRKSRNHASSLLDATDKLAIATEALRFYADKKHIVETDFCSVGNLEERCKNGFTIESEYFLHEDGKRARDALERLK